VQFIGCDVAAVIRPIAPSPDSTSEDDIGHTCANGSTYYEVVGRALLLRIRKVRNTTNVKSKLGTKSGLFPWHTALDNVKDQFACYLDIELLSALTR
jgi:hypothetical protein